MQGEPRGPTFPPGWEEKAGLKASEILGCGNCPGCRRAKRESKGAQGSSEGSNHPAYPQQQQQQQQQQQAARWPQASGSVQSVDAGVGGTPPGSPPQPVISSPHFLDSLGFIDFDLDSLMDGVVYEPLFGEEISDVDSDEEAEDEQVDEDEYGDDDGDDSDFGDGGGNFSDSRGGGGGRGSGDDHQGCSGSGRGDNGNGENNQDSREGHGHGHSSYQGNSGDAVDEEQYHADDDQDGHRADDDSDGWYPVEGCISPHTVCSADDDDDDDDDTDEDSVFSDTHAVVLATNHDDVNTSATAGDAGIGAGAAADDVGSIPELPLLLSSSASDSRPAAQTAEGPRSSRASISDGTALSAQANTNSVQRDAGDERVRNPDARRVRSAGTLIRNADVLYKGAVVGDSDGKAREIPAGTEEPGTVSSHGGQEAAAGAEQPGAGSGQGVASNVEQQGTGSGQGVAADAEQQGTGSGQGVASDVERQGTGSGRGVASDVERQGTGSGQGVANDAERQGTGSGQGATAHAEERAGSSAKGDQTAASKRQIAKSQEAIGRQSVGADVPLTVARVADVLRTRDSTSESADSGGRVTNSEGKVTGSEGRMAGSARRVTDSVVSVPRMVDSSPEEKAVFVTGLAYSEL